MGDTLKVPSQSQSALFVFKDSRFSCVPKISILSLSVVSRFCWDVPQVISLMFSVYIWPSLKTRITSQVSLNNSVSVIILRLVYLNCV